jgi:uncharacterized protein (DUF433 family)
MLGRKEEHAAMTEYPCITLDPKVLAGEPVIRGTRLSVEFWLMADAWSEADIVANFPGIAHDRYPRLSGLRARCAQLGESVSERGVRCGPSPTMNFPGAAVAALAEDGHDASFG